MASNRDHKAPPSMRKDLPYSEWKHEVQIWKAFTNLEKKKLGPALFLSLEGSARAAAHEVPLDELSSDTGIDVLLNKLDSLFLKDQNNAAFEAYDVFERYQRPQDMSMWDYINVFERLYQKAKHFKFELPDGVLAYRLLRSANLSEAHEQLARATLPSLTYSNMKEQLKKIFINNVKTVEGAMKIKLEPIDSGGPVDSGDSADVYYTQRGRGQNYRRGYGYRGGRGKSDRFPSVPQPSGSGGPGAQRKKATNPRDAYGNITKCAVCGSCFHWARKCPDRQVFQADVEEQERDSEANEDILITLFTNSMATVSDAVSERANDDGLLGETFNYGIIDSGCSKSVCGQAWYDCLVGTMSRRDVNLIKEEKSSTTFKFGDGVRVVSLKRVVFPATLANKRVRISTDVIPNDIPLLLSKEALKKCDAVLDFSDDKVLLFGTKVPLSVTSNGHYIVPISCHHVNAPEAGNYIQDVLFCSKVEKATYSDRLKMATKIHRQFGHPRSNKLKSLCSDAGVTDRNFLELFDVVDARCDICKRYKRTPSRPVVGFNMARDFNDVVALDLKQWSYTPAVWFCHMIDLATRYSVCVIIKHKDKSTIVNAIMSGWISKFGSPCQFLSDNGMEFNNEDFREMAGAFNIRVCTTAAESPWSNGCNERYNGIISETVKKVMEDTPCSLEMALAWAVSAKNSLENHNGFSPNQLVFGRNPNLPSCLSDMPPALEPLPSSCDLVRKHLNAMHRARQMFVQNEACEKLRRSLLYKVRPRGTRFETGDVVFYRRSQADKWRGPATVIGQENKQILVKHGGVYYRCHSHMVMKSDDSTKNTDGQSGGSESKVCSENKNMASPPDNATFDDTDDEFEANNGNLNDGKETSLVNKNAAAKVSDDLHEGDVSNVQENTGILSGVEGNANTFTGPRVVIKEKQTLPTAKSRISYVLPGTSQWTNATVLGRAGKATGKNKFWINVLDDGDVAGKSVDWQQVDDWRNLHEDVLICWEDDIMEAKRMELENWKDNDVYEAVQDCGQECISCRWIITEKQSQDGSSFIKARLVARGFEEDSSELQTDSPTCGKESLRIVLAIAASKEWVCNSCDVKAAFLQGAPLQRKVFIRPPPEAQTEGTIWRMKTCVYGLSDASRYWYLRVRKELLNLGMMGSELDTAIFYWRTDSGLEGIITLHVDDFLWCGTSRFQESIIERIRQIFRLGSEESGIFKYLGLHIHQQHDKVIIMHQDPLVDDLRGPRISHERSMQKEEGLTDEEITVLRSISGRMNWLASQTRPDLAFDVCNLSCTIKEAKIKDLQTAAKIIRKSQSTRVCLKFPNLDLTKSSIVVFSDASYGNLPDGSSQGGFIIFLRDETGQCAPLIWSSTKIKRIVRSTLAAECMAMQDGADSAYLISSLLSEILYGGTESIKVTCYTDSRGLYRSLYSTKAAQDKRLRIDIARLRQMINTGEISQVCWVDSIEQLADCLTKKTASTSSLLDILHKGKF